MRFPLIFIAGLAIAIAIAPSDVDDTLQNSLGDSNVKVADAGSFAILSYVPNDDDDIEDNTGVPILGDSNSPSEAFTGDTAALAPSDTCDLPGAHRRSEVFNGNTIAFAPDDACASPDTLQKDPLPVIYPPGAGAATGPRHELYKDPDLDPATPNGPVECKPLNTGHHNEYEAYCCIGKLVPQYSPRWDVWNIDKCSKSMKTYLHHHEYLVTDTTSCSFIYR